MDVNDLCLIYAPVIAVAVSLLKRIPFIAKSPKVVAAILAIAFNVVGVTAVGGTVTADIIRCVLMSFGGTVAVYETVIKPTAAKFV